ncbi:MnhB domain-containing protein, partial [Chloroflexota bacterium]
PGGGFQGGVMLAVSIILQRIYLGNDTSKKIFPPDVARVISVIGVLIYIIAGFAPMLFGGEFLDYSLLPIPWVHGAELRSLGILIVESGIGLAVFGTIVLIYDTISGERW